ncbi:MAG: acylphosphatase [Candidatus Baltobacteraceae bacterium]
MKREIVTLNGRVQGVGFREAIVALARVFPVSGSVRNLRTERAVEIDLEGESADIDAFVVELIAHPPGFARIEGIDRREAPTRGTVGFERAPTG